MISGGAFAAQLMLAAVFIVAGISKLRDPPAARRGMLAFGVPSPLAVPVAVALPIVEIGVAIALLVPATASLGAIAAVALLLTFMAAVAGNLARGREVDCQCFGQLHAAPAGALTLVRNALLATAAGFVAVVGGGDAAATFSWLPDIPLATLAVAAFTGFVAFHLLRQQGRLLLRVDELEAALAESGMQVNGVSAAARVEVPGGLEIGAEAPSFQLPDLNGAKITGDSLRSHGAPVLLLFSDPGCGPCTALLPEVASWQAEHSGELTIALVSRGAVAANGLEAERHGLENVLLQRDREVAEIYEAWATPTGVLIDREGLIAAAPAAGADALRRIVLEATRAPMPSVEHIPSARTTRWEETLPAGIGVGT